jgi:hypothetical protein
VVILDIGRGLRSQNFEIWSPIQKVPPIQIPAKNMEMKVLLNKKIHRRKKSDGTFIL